MEQISGIIQRVKFANPENGFAILDVEVKDSQKSGTSYAVVKGSVIEPKEGFDIECEGKYIKDPKWGMQFQADNIVIKDPSTEQGVLNYLSSGMIPGIGPAYAKKLVDHYGENVFTEIRKNPNSLRKISGIGQAKQQAIIDGIKKQAAVEEIMLFLHENDVSKSYAVKIYKKHGDNAKKVLRDNPYLLTEIDGIGFKSADKIALKFGVSRDSNFRIETALHFVIEHESKSRGHTCLGIDDLFSKTAALLDIDGSKIEIVFDHVVNEGDLVVDKVLGADGAAEAEYVYAPRMYFAEKNIAKRIVELNGQAKHSGKAAIKSNAGLSPSQEDSFKNAFNYKFGVLTGGPGTGKTTVTRTILDTAESFGFQVALAAPTGRAARRMSEATGREASTIHKMLGALPGGGFNHDEHNPLELDFLVVDEYSMVDNMLCSALMKALPGHAHVLNVGDVDQLQSVGAGDVLNDMIRSGRVPVSRLTEIFRQDGDSGIIRNMHLINAGKMPNISSDPDGDFQFIRTDGGRDTEENVIDLVSRIMPQRYGISSEEIQVLSPMKERVLGVKTLNEQLQEELNPDRGQDSVKVMYTDFRVGDRIMQTSNNYELDIYNGDVGYIRFIDKAARNIIADIEGVHVTIPFESADDLTLAYASTIHKSQGSEYRGVVVPLSMAHSYMLNKNLLYTAGTRAKEKVFFVGNPKALGLGVSRVNQAIRNTGLDRRIQELMQPARERSCDSSMRKMKEDALAI